MTTPRSRRSPRWSIRPSRGATTARRVRRGATRSSTKCTSAAFRSGTRRCPRAARHVLGADDGAGNRSFEEAWRDRRRADARASSHPRIATGQRNGAHELLGVQHPRLLRAGHPLLGVGGAGRIGARVQADGPGPACGRPRSHSRRRLQPHGRGQSPRPDAVAEGHRQHVVLPARRRPTRATTWTSRAAATR